MFRSSFNYLAFISFGFYLESFSDSFGDVGQVWFSVPNFHITLFNKVHTIAVGFQNTEKFHTIFSSF